MNKKVTKYIRFSLLSAWPRCQYAAYLNYKVGVRPEIEPYNFLVGHAIDGAVEFYVKNEDLDEAKKLAIETFDKGYDNGTPIPASWTADNVRDMLTRWLELLDEFWQNQNGRYQVLGTQVQVNRPIPNSPFISTGTLDLLLYDTQDQYVFIVDAKSCASLYGEDFITISGQLINYTFLIEGVKDSLPKGFKGIKCGFWEFTKTKVPEPPKLNKDGTPSKRKQGKGPQFVASEAMIPTQEQIEDYLELARRTGRSLNEDRPLKAYNRIAFESPCDMCDLQEYCMRGDTEGLVFPESIKEAA